MNGTVIEDGGDLDTARSRWSGRTAVVTGAAGGLGLAFAEVLASVGADVVRCDVDAEALAATAGTGDDVVLDVRDHTATDALAERLHGEGRDVALVIANAGVEHVGFAWQQSYEDWNRIVDVNLNGVYHAVRAFVPGMLAAAGDCTMLNVASVGALVPSGMNAAYTVTKHAVLALSEALADGIAASGGGVQVSVALPGPVRTRIYEDAAATGDAGSGLTDLRALLADQGMAPDDAAKTMLAQVAAGRFAVTSHPGWVRALADQRIDRLRTLLDP